MNDIRPRVILHPGPPKTGTSTLQAWCHLNRTALAAQGVVYASVDKPSDPKHQWLVQGLKQGDLSRLGAEIAPLRDGSAHTLILSCEGVMTNRGLIPDSAWQQFRQVLSGLDTTLFMVERDLDGWLRSLWKQALINPVPRGKPLAVPPFEAFARRPAIRAMMDLGAMAGLIARDTGAASWVLTRLEDDFIGDFARLLDLSPDRPMRDAPRINESLPADFIAVYGRLARHVDQVWHLRMAVFAAFHAMRPTGNLMVANVARQFAKVPAHDRDNAVDTLQQAVDAVSFDDPGHRDLAARLASNATVLRNILLQDQPPPPR
ncbi:hypothetical protein [Paracoccus sp. Ld10]|uniref:hypothetical protein n=1 Tax=Paracoccus sp. Ld10 TaxID=649158 RepID=UPI00387048BC